MGFISRAEQGTFHSFLATDGVELQGFLMSPSEEVDCAVLHVHGLAGNFYENPFVLEEAEALARNGWGMFAFNNRGHDYIADLMQWSDAKGKAVRGGGAFEVFTECVHDINGAVEVLRSLGYNRIVLQGHSTGCNKVFHYCREEKAALPISGLILLSPCDDVGMIKGSLGEQYETTLADAQAMSDRGEGNALMPGDPFFGYPMSARTFVEMARENGAHDIFRYRLGATAKAIGSVCDIGMLAVFGGEDDYLDVPERVAKGYLTQLTSGPLSFCRISTAPHSYRGTEDALVRRIVAWLGNGEKHAN